jgi:pimeloyl-ACP methyl ester carboxylesterase
MSEISPLVSSKEASQTTRSVESFGGKAKFVDIRPESLVSEIPVLVAGGWAEGSKSLGQVGREISVGGRRAILVDHARFGKVQDRSDYPAEIVHKANTLLAVLDEVGIDKVDVIAHSEGALNAVYAAMQQPERFRSLILVAPAGMIGEDSVLALAGRFAPKVIRGLSKDFVENPKAAFIINSTGLPYMAKNPAKAAREVKTIADTTIDSALVDLRHSDIQIGLIQSHSDPVFPAERIEKHIVLDDELGNVDAYASVAAKDAGHDDLLIHPERSTRAAMQMIEQFE